LNNKPDTGWDGYLEAIFGIYEIGLRKTMTTQLYRPTFEYPNVRCTKVFM